MQGEGEKMKGKEKKESLSRSGGKMWSIALWLNAKQTQQKWVEGLGGELV